MLNTITASVVTATTTHAVRARNNQRPRKVGGGEAREPIVLDPTPFFFVLFVTTPLYSTAAFRTLLNRADRSLLTPGEMGGPPRSRVLQTKIKSTSSAPPSSGPSGSANRYQNTALGHSRTSPGTAPSFLRCHSRYAARTSNALTETKTIPATIDHLPHSLWLARPVPQ